MPAYLANGRGGTQPPTAPSPRVETDEARPM